MWKSSSGPLCNVRSAGAPCRVHNSVHGYANIPYIGNALYEDAYLLGTSLARPVIARAMMKVAKQYNCEFLSHGCKQSTLPLRTRSVLCHTNPHLPYLRYRQGCKFSPSMYLKFRMLTRVE